MGYYSLPEYGPVDSVNRPLRTRMRGGVGAGGLNHPATRLDSLARYRLQDGIRHPWLALGTKVRFLTLGNTESKVWRTLFEEAVKFLRDPAAEDVGDRAVTYFFGPFVEHG